jgi:hypothetical protein
MNIVNTEKNLSTSTSTRLGAIGTLDPAHHAAI